MKSYIPHRGVPRALPAARGGRDRPDRLRGGQRPRPPGHGLLGLRSRSWGSERRTPTRVDLAVPAGSDRPHIDYPPASTSLERGTSYLAASRWRWARTSVFASLTPKGLSSTVSVSDIASGSTSPSPVCAGTFAVRCPPRAASSNWPRRAAVARRSSQRCGCCRDELGPTRLDCGARLSRPPPDSTSARSTDPRIVADLRARAVPLSVVEVRLSRPVCSQGRNAARRRSARTGLSG